MKHIISIVLLLLLLAILTPEAMAQERPLAVIEFCDAGGCNLTKNGGFVWMFACGEAMLRSASYDPQGLPLTASWSVNGKNAGTGSQLNFSWPREGTVDVRLEVTNGYLSDTTSITVGVGESTPPVIENLTIISGSDRKATVIEPEQQLKKIDSAANFLLTIQRNYRQRADGGKNNLTQEFSSNNIDVLNKTCTSSACETNMTLSAGRYSISFTDRNLCGASYTAEVVFETFKNKPPKAVISGDILWPESSGGRLNGSKESEDRDPTDRITRYDWNVTSVSGNLLRQYSNKSEILINGLGPDEYNVTLCATDRFGGTGCVSTPVFVLESYARSLSAVYSGPKTAEVFKNITLDASNSTPWYKVTVYEWNITYLHKFPNYGEQWISYEKFRTHNPRENVSFDRSGKYRVELTAYGGGLKNTVTVYITVSSAPTVTATPVPAATTMPPTAIRVTPARTSVTPQRTSPPPPPTKETPMGFEPIFAALLLSFFLKRKKKR